MLLSDGTIKVTDFGIARLTRNELRATTEDGNKAIGSVHYISPEQARGDITDEKADLYSVGIMLYEMLTGRLPFEADNAVSVAIMQMQSEATLPHNINEDIPEGLEQITMKAMQKDTAKRYQSAAEMLSDFDEFKHNPSIKFAYTYLSDEKPTRYVDAITRVRGDSPAEEEETQEEPTGGKKLSTVAILGAVAAAIVLVAAVFIFIFLKFFGGLGSKENITVDNFVGMSYADEVATHPNLGNYTIGEPQTGYNADYPEGYVYKQEPEAGDTIKMKGELTLYVSLGSRLAEVPTVTPGESVTLVRSRLTGAGFTVKEVEESSLEYKAGTVIRLSPESGNKVQYGSEITMFVSSGEPVAEPIDMPNVIGVSLNDALDMLSAAGFDRNKVTTTVVNDPAMKDTVLAMTPDYTVQQLPDVNIQLEVSSGFQNVMIELELPDTTVNADLQFYVAGNKDAKLTKKYTDIIPRDIGTLEFEVGATQKSYVVTVKIAKAGSKKFEVFASYKVDGEDGTYELTESNPFTAGETTTTTTTTTEKTKTTTTEESTTTTEEPTSTEATTTTTTQPESSEDANTDPDSDPEEDVSEGEESSDVVSEPEDSTTPDESSEEE